MPELLHVPTVDAAPLFPDLHRELVSLLAALTPAEWDRPTIAGRWRVRDVAAHLLDGDLRKLAAHRDGHSVSGEPPPTSYSEVVALIGRLNAEGVTFGARLSTRLLTDLLELSGRWVSEFVASLDPDATALYSVAWAGETQSDNRFDTAREYTERWHHQMQIRDAIEILGQSPVLLTPKYFTPLLHTCVRALPHAYGVLAAPEGTRVEVQIVGATQDVFTLRRAEDQWELYRGSSERPSVRVIATADVIWRILFNALPPSAAEAALKIDGPAYLAAPLLEARSVMV